MPSKATDTALRDILHHIDLAAAFAAEFDRNTFKGDLKTVYAVTHGWVLEVVNQKETSTVRDDLFATDTEAFAEFNRTLETEGIRAFLDGP